MQFSTWKAWILPQCEWKSGIYVWRPPIKNFIFIWRMFQFDDASLIQRTKKKRCKNKWIIWMLTILYVQHKQNKNILNGIRNLMICFCHRPFLVHFFGLWSSKKFERIIICFCHNQLCFTEQHGMYFIFCAQYFLSFFRIHCVSNEFFHFFFFWCYKRTGTKFFCLFFDGMKSIDPRYCVNGLSEWNIENMKSTTLCFPVKLSASVMLHMRTVCFMDHWFIVSNLKLFKIESSSGNDYLLET